MLYVVHWHSVTYYLSFLLFISFTEHYAAFKDCVRLINLPVFFNISCNTNSPNLHGKIELIFFSLPGKIFTVKYFLYSLGVRNSIYFC